MKLSWLCPVGCLSLAETANRAESGQLQFWSELSEILNVRSSNTTETVAFTYLDTKLGETPITHVHVNKIHRKKERKIGA